MFPGTSEVIWKWVPCRCNCMRMFILILELYGPQAKGIRPLSEEEHWTQSPMRHREKRRWPWDRDWYVGSSDQGISRLDKCPETGKDRKTYAIEKLIRECSGRPVILTYQPPEWERTKLSCSKTPLCRTPFVAAQGCLRPLICAEMSEPWYM